MARYLVLPFLLWITAAGATVGAAILRYLARQNPNSDFSVLPRKFALNRYGFALPDGSRRRESVNRAVLAHIDRPEWDDTVYRYTGGAP